MSQSLHGTAHCRVPRADGSCLQVSATVMLAPADGMARIKLSPALRFHPAAERIVEIIRSARLAEPVPDERWRVTCDITPPPTPQERGWELAVVLADRMARGLWRPQADVLALGCSDDWLGGALHVPLAEQACLDAVRPQANTLCIRGAMTTDSMQVVLASDWRVLGNIAELCGQAASDGFMRRASTWFPAVWDGAADRLIRIDVVVRPLPTLLSAGDGPVSVFGLPRARHEEVTLVLEHARQADPKGPGRWMTLVRFESASFSGKSCELALVLADRLARGREPRQRPEQKLIATGSSQNWASGQICNVQGSALKLPLILAQVGQGDRVILPGAWRTEVAPEFLWQMTQRQATVVFVDKIL